MKASILHDLNFSDPGYQLTYLIHQVGEATWRAIEERLIDEHITLSQLRMLIIVNYSDTPLTPAEICRLIFRESQTITSSLSQLQKKGYVQKVADTEDKRKVRIQLTESGKQLVEKHNQWISDALSGSVSLFSKEEL